MITLKQAQELFEKVMKAHENGDDEAAHGYEDDLHEAVIRAVAAGSHQSKALLKLALKTYDLDFKRWCA